MINDPLIELKDRLWREVERETEAKSLEQKQGLLRGLHVRLYDEAATERGCIAIRDQALVEIDRLVEIPKEPTDRERMDAMQAEIDELKKGRN